MRNVLVLLGALLALGGLVFLLQGMNVLPGSFMTGQSLWAWVGIALLLVGVLLVVGGLAGRRRR